MDDKFMTNFVYFYLVIPRAAYYGYVHMATQEFSTGWKLVRIGVSFTLNNPNHTILLVPWQKSDAKVNVGLLKTAHLPPPIDKPALALTSRLGQNVGLGEG